MSDTGPGWRDVALGDCGRWLSGGTPSTRNDEYWGGELPWISASSLKSFRIKNSARRLTDLGANSGTRVVPKDTILFVVRGMSLKTEFRVGITQRQVAFGQDCKAIVVGPGMDPLYLAYALDALSPEILELVDEAGHGTGRLATDRLERLRVPVPSLTEQVEIARTLSLLDDKIEAEQGVVAAADDLCLAVVDALAAQGRVEMRPLSSLARFINGRNYTKAATQSGRMVVRIAEINSGPGASTVYNDVEVSADHVVSPGEILFSWSGSLAVQRWARDEAIVNQHIFKVIPGEGVPPWLVYGSLLRLLESFQRIAADKATTMGHIQRRHLDAEVMVPKPEQLTELQKVCHPLWERMIHSERQIASLRVLRAELARGILDGALQSTPPHLARIS